MAGVSATYLDTHVACGNVELIMNHEQLFGANLVLTAQLGNGTARGVHVRLRLDEHDLALTAFFFGIVDVDDGDKCARLVFPIGDARLACERIDGTEAGVVASVLVLLARVAESCDHADFHRLCSCHAAPFVDLSPAMVSDSALAVKRKGNDGTRLISEA